MDVENEEEEEEEEEEEDEDEGEAVNAEALAPAPTTPPPPIDIVRGNLDLGTALLTSTTLPLRTCSFTAVAASAPRSSSYTTNPKPRDL